MHAQRQRWEHGHIYMIGSVAISLFCRGIASRDINLTALSLDLLVPPVSLLSFVILALLAVSGVGAVCGLTPLAFILSVGCLFLLATSITLAWLKFGSDVLPAKSLLQVPGLYMGKVAELRQAGPGPWRFELGSIGPSVVETETTRGSLHD